MISTYQDRQLSLPAPLPNTYLVQGLLAQHVLPDMLVNLSHAVELLLTLANALLAMILHLQPQALACLHRHLYLLDYALSVTTALEVFASFVPKGLNALIKQLLLLAPSKPTLDSATLSVLAVLQVMTALFLTSSV